MANEILSPFLGFIESVCTFDLTKDFIDSHKSNATISFKHSVVYESMMSLLHRHISLANRTTILTIIFTLHFRVSEHNCPSEFIPELYRMLSDLEVHVHAPHDGHASEASAARKMILALVVSASASETNHRAIIESGFYT